MKGLNKFIGIGYLGADPEIRYLPSGNAVCNFSFAVNEEWKDKQTGEDKKRTEWIRCECWGKMAENCSQYLQKGSPVFVEGRIRTDKVDDADTGTSRYYTKIRLDNVQFLGGKDEHQPVTTQAPQNNTQSDEIPF